MKNYANDIAASMDAFLNDPKNKEMYAPYGLNKVAFTKVSDESKPTELEVEIAEELSIALDPVQASEQCEKCKSSGCFSTDKCKENCSCGCKEDKKVAMDNEDKIVKSAFDALMKVSDDLESAGYEKLAANTLVLVNHLIVEAKAKKNNKKEDKSKEKEKADKLKMKEKADKEKEKAKIEKDKNAAKDKVMKEKEKAAKEKAKAKEDAAKKSKK